MTERNTPALRVLMTTDTVGGVWTYCMELCEALQMHNAEVHLVTEGGLMSTWQKEEVDRLKNVTVYETEHALEWMPDPWQSIDKAGEWLLALAGAIHPDIVHLNGYTYAALPWPCATLIVAHSDVFSWFFAVKETAPSREWDEYYLRVKRGLAHTDLVIAPSLGALHVLQQVYGMPGNKKVIYNGRSSSHFTPKEKKPYVMAMGRVWDEAKNIKLLADNASAINYQIRIAGAASYAGDSIAFDQPNITYLGKLDGAAIAEELSAASVFVLPARYEPFGLSALEAALSGCALVLGAIDTLQEIWQGNAIYVDPDDGKALAETINALMSNKALREQYAEKAYTHARQFTASFMAQQYVESYEQVLEHSLQNT